MFRSAPIVLALFLGACSPSREVHTATVAPAVTFAGESASSGRIPLDADRSMLAFRASVNGVATTVFLDSGAEGIVLDEEFARRIGVTPEGSHRARGSGGTQSASVGRHVDLEIGGFRQIGLTAYVLDLSGVAAAARRPVPVIVGANLFERTVVEFDPADRTVAFHDPSRFVAPASAVRVPLERAARRLRAVGVEIEDRPPVLLLLDTGFGGPLALHSSYWEKERLLEGRTSSAKRSFAIGGAWESRIATLRTVRFAGIAFADVPASFDPRTGSRVSGYHGLLGWQILRRFRWIADYSTDSLYLIPYEPDIAKPFRRSRTGFGR